MRARVVYVCVLYIIYMYNTYILYIIYTYKYIYIYNNIEVNICQAWLIYHYWRYDIKARK